MSKALNQELVQKAVDNHERLLAVAKAVEAGFDYNPGHSEDDEQPIVVRMTLGQYRNASGAVYGVTK